MLDALSGEETDALLDGLGGTVLESDQRARIVETAEGNPLFLEQLLALALEGGLAERPLPETIQALLAARLDRLGPGERAVLERGAVVGKEFAADDVVALLDPEAAPTADTHLRTLAGRGFVRPARGAAVRVPARPRAGGGLPLGAEAAAGGASRALRRPARRDVAADLAELDEFVGYHLEQAYSLRTELGESDRRTERLAEDAGRRLGEAGIRAIKRGDMPATVSLLDRAIRLLPKEADARHELMCELGIAQYSRRGHRRRHQRRSVERSMSAVSAGQRRVELRARVWRPRTCDFSREPEGAARSCWQSPRGAVPHVRGVDDARSLARAWLFIGYVRGGIHGNHAAWEEAEERALAYYQADRVPDRYVPSADRCGDLLGADPGAHGISRCARAVSPTRRSAIFGRAAILPFLGGLHAQPGSSRERARLIDEAEETLTELGALGGSRRLLWNRASRRRAPGWRSSCR